MHTFLITQKHCRTTCATSLVWKPTPFLVPKGAGFQTTTSCCCCQQMDYLLELAVVETIDLAEPRPLVEALKYFQWMIGLV